MHIKAPIMIHGNGVRWSQCAKCGKAFGLNDGFCEGSHLCCGDCGQNLLLAKMSNLEWEALCEQYPATRPAMTTIKPSQFPKWECSGISHVAPGPDVVGYVSTCPSRLMFPIQPAPLGGGKTVALEEYCRVDIDATVKAREQINQRAIRQFVARAAYKLGASFTTSDIRQIKSELAARLRQCGVRYSDIETIISDMVEAIKPC